MINQLLFILIASAPGAFAEPLTCGDVLAHQLPSALIDFGRFGGLKAYKGQLRATLDGQTVFLKQLDLPGVRTEAYLRMLERVARALAAVEAGPRYFGLTLNPETKRFVQIFEFIEGQVIYAVDKRLERDAVITPGTIETVRLAFNVLDGLNVLAEDAQFIVTPEGRAVMIDYDQFQDEDHPPEVIRENRMKLSWLEKLFRRHVALAGAL